MSLLTLYQDIVSPFHNVIFQLERDGFKVDEQVRKQLTSETRSKLSILEKEIRDAASNYVTHWLPPCQSDELGSCSAHPDYQGRVKRAKCEGCVRVYQQRQGLRLAARGVLVEQRRRWGASVSGEFKIRSDAHWRRLLFDSSPGGHALSPSHRRRTKKQKLSQVDKDAIAELSRAHPEQPLLKLKARFDTLEHDLSTYLQVKVDSRGFAHPCYHMMTSTGRLGSGDDGFEPSKRRVSEAGNMQNVPDRLRRMYVADDDESWLVQADWRQVEALVTAWLAGDEEMAGVILDGSRDIHSENALVLAETIGYEGLTLENADEIPFPYDPGGRSFRQAGKLTHKLHYGMGADKFSRTYGIPKSTCAGIITAYFKRWPKLAVWQQATIEEAQQERSLSTCFGRILRFWSFNAKGRLQDREEALAFRSQSIVGDMIKVVGRRLSDAMPNGSRLVTTTHDSWTVSTNWPEKIVPLVKKLMEREWPEMGSCGRLKMLWCPVEVSAGKCWQKFHATKCEGGLKKWQPLS